MPPNYLVARLGNKASLLTTGKPLAILSSVTRAVPPGSPPSYHTSHATEIHPTKATAVFAKQLTLSSPRGQPSLKGITTAHLDSYAVSTSEKHVSPPVMWAIDPIQFGQKKRQGGVRQPKRQHKAQTYLLMLHALRLDQQTCGKPVHAMFCQLTHSPRGSIHTNGTYFRRRAYLS
ncbi:hypothetical protein B0T14DRAFT_121132 [Immersiella caudata]|uniref:Uncharacterized protein n=1 Tax=Immersiella caudata TaxID=314043 RepID=A0AA40C6F5_9PEZI|nr:hypothetical protein B0T14DRAFT_121132 [Immersiella caudata]